MLGTCNWIRVAFLYIPSHVSQSTCGTQLSTCALLLALDSCNIYIYMYICLYIQANAYRIHFLYHDTVFADIGTVSSFYNSMEAPSNIEHHGNWLLCHIISVHALRHVSTVFPTWLLLRNTFFVPLSFSSNGKTYCSRSCLLPLKSLHWQQPCGT